MTDNEGNAGESRRRWFVKVGQTEVVIREMGDFGIISA